MHLKNLHIIEWRDKSIIRIRIREKKKKWKNDEKRNPYMNH